MSKLSAFERLTLFAILMSAMTFTAAAQTASRKVSAKTPAVPAVAPAATPPSDPISETRVPAKKNGRPDARPSQVPDGSQGQAVKFDNSTSAYYYEFSQPDFVINKIIIQHDDSGAGTISFMKRGYSELVTDPIRISAAALERINDAYTVLNFLDSNDSYQYEKDYSHLGTTTYKLKRDGRERTTTFNWTVHKDAKILADEYRKIGNQFIWVFDITVSRENQPLEAPRLLDSLDSLIKRNEISDTTQMVPLLRGLADDERIPLIARNHAGKLVKDIEKVKK